ncbi:hypothetical protein DT070_12485 [Polaromonas sp. SP1]|nr:hypothetical protein DT070_12485 [Polaromonas sp. SP1]
MNTFEVSDFEKLALLKRKTRNRIRQKRIGIWSSRNQLRWEDHAHYFLRKVRSTDHPAAIRHRAREGWADVSKKRSINEKWVCHAL